ncbi:MAG: glycoside hydrolase family 30 beta sandwich domain-containing protein [Planctomycetota bacterium]
MRMVDVLLTSEAGSRMERIKPIEFRTGASDGPSITVFPERRKQTIDGIGTSFTESSAFVLAHLDPARRREVMERIYGEDGANFSLTRTHIGSCDFSVEGRYSYADRPGDLHAFSVAVDRAGFDPGKYPGIKDPAYDLLPMIEEAMAIKAEQEDGEIRIIASAWTAPPWMKDVEDWFVPASAENGWQGTGGKLKPEHESTYAAYLVKYLEAYASEGVPIWGLTPVNEPHGNSGQWESMHFTPASQNEFIKRHLGPTLRGSAHRDTRVLIYDQNRDGLEEWTDAILGDPETAPFVFGVAVHWYSSTFKVHEDVFERVNAKFPAFPIIHTEGCIDDLGKDAPEGVGDPERFKESGWFDNDDFWWNPNATDWAYTAPWASPSVEDHPIYTPVHRYARNIIVSLDHWMTGWVDWNIVLDRDGGPNHVGNFCGAPIMIDRESGHVHYTPVFYVLAQLSRTIRPGDVALQTERDLGGLGADAFHACATVNGDGVISVQLLNTTKSPIEFDLRIGDAVADVVLPANCVQTIRIAR